MEHPWRNLEENFDPAAANVCILITLYVHVHNVTTSSKLNLSLCMSVVSFSLMYCESSHFSLRTLIACYKNLFRHHIITLIMDIIISHLIYLNSSQITLILFCTFISHRLVPVPSYYTTFPITYILIVLM